jgi:putative methyltransferase (TIGR04325 family)
MIKIRDFIPPIAHRMKSVVWPPKYGWFGDYSTWQDALDNSTGYNSVLIVEKVKDALMKVRQGEAVYERDSVLFEEIQYSWPLLTGLMWAAAQDEGKLNVMDFGGSLGSTYFQNRQFLSSLKKVKWNVIEQELFVEYGKKYFEDTTLMFYREIDSCYANEKPNVALFSCVLQYLEFPYETLKSHFENSPKFIIVDNMPFLTNGKKITVQKVPPEIYEASYPCWLLNRSEFLNFFKPRYEMVAGFKSGLSINVDSNIIPYEGFIFRNIQ